MEELKLLIEMVAKLPNTALYVLLGYLVYKLAIVGSIFGLIRFAIEKAHNYLVTPKHKLTQENRTTLVQSLVIKDDFDRLLAQLHRVAGRGLNFPSEYIHHQSVDWLREAIDDKIEKDQKK